MPECGYEITDSSSVRHLFGMVAELAKHINQKKRSQNLGASHYDLQVAIDLSGRGPEECGEEVTTLLLSSVW